MLFGLGGVGSYAAEALARSAVGTIYLIDFDNLEPSNLNRQLLALYSTLGRPKTEVMASRIKDIDPEIRVFSYTERLTAENIDRFLSLDPDWIIDCIDDVPMKILLMAKCLSENRKLVSSMGFANKFHPELIEIGTLAETSVCPLAKAMRLAMKQTGLPLTTPVVFSREAPQKTINPDIKLGSTAFVPAAAGLSIAGYVIRNLLEIGAE